MYSMTPKYVYAEFYANFKSMEIGNYWKKESYLPKKLRVGSTEENKLQFCTLF